MNFYIKDFYLNTPMKWREYMRLELSDLHEYFINKYKLTAKTTKDSYMYIKICKGMYGLLQSGILAQQLLGQRLNERGYRHISLTPGYRKHDRRPIYFTLFVEKFGLNYVREEYAKHLVNSLK